MTKSRRKVRNGSNLEENRRTNVREHSNINKMYSDNMSTVFNVIRILNNTM